MKKFKLIFVLIFVFAFSAVFLTACGSDEAAADDELYELVFLRDYDVSDTEQFAYRNQFRNYVEENFGITWHDIHFAGDMQQRLMLELAGGNFPSVINPRDTNVLRAYAEAGALINLGELLEQYAPNVLERHADRLPVWRAMSGMNDGNIWAMTFWQPDQMGARAMPQLQWLIRSDILEQQGFPEIRDENDFLEVIRRGLEDNPTTNGRPTIGFSHPLNAWGTAGLQVLTYTYNLGRLSHYTFNRGMIFDPYINEFIDVTSDHGYRNGLEFFNLLWRDGIFDRDSVTDDWDDFERKMREGQILSAFFLTWPWDYDFNPALEAAGAPFRYVPMTFQLTSQRERNETMIVPQNSGEVWSSIAITTNAEHPERIARLLNWQASEEGMIRAGWGREGVDFTVENGRRVPTQEHFDRMANDPSYIHELFGPSDFGFFLGVDPSGQSYRITHDADVVAMRLDPIVRSVWEQYGWSGSYEMFYHNANFTFDDTHQVGLKGAVPTLTDALHRNWEIMDAATHDATMQLVTASSVEVFNQLFDDMQARRAELGLHEMLELWNAEYIELRRIHGFD